ncbi:MobF family relaxase [Blastomonas sp.]|uniref:MobF family relaxase n=1 Tax=Blastomonas sp. TaxID=1909299 RepID=UPI002629A308|nr:MobF family relaxase [Blastomonas sp.]MDM7955927.1 MobF family relaxase [Blastomonas sp.]
MVAKPIKLTDPAAAYNYYQADDYWSREAAGQWKGRAARALGLEGEVDPDQFMSLLKGQLPNGTQIGTSRKGVREHTPGFDLTMSAPKSVSVIGLVAGDRRVIDAHARAVDVALGYAERHIGVTRIRNGETVERIATEKLAIAQFLHVTARETENGTPAPQIHSHNVILNMTQDCDSNWRSLDARDLYRLQKHIGAVYHMELAAELRQLGYSVIVAPDTTFEIDGVPEHVLRAFSPRSRQIEAALAARGQTRANASAAEKSVIALKTRAPKRTVNYATLAATWRTQADELGLDEDARRALVDAAEAQAVGRPNLGTIRRMAEADKAVSFAMAKLSERQAVFTAADLEREAGQKASGAATHGDVVAAIARAERKQALMVRAAPRMAKGIVGYTTREAVITEQAMLAMETEGRETGKPIVGLVRAEAAIASAERRSAHAWTEGQKVATRQLLLSSSAVTGLQGHAGTAKTTTVLKTVAEAARTQKKTVRALAPTATAADVLGRAIKAEPTTVARMLSHSSELSEPGTEVWIVDEASMLSARDARRLIARARDAKAKLILVGDVEQLGSVEAGRAFGQLREAGMETAVMDEIVRQSNHHTRKAVEAMLAGDASAAFDALDAGGGSIVEHEEDDVRHALMARDFVKLSPEERAATIVLDTTREGRQRLTASIRFALVRDGTLGEQAMIAKVLEPVGFTRAEARNAASYQPGQIVTFRKGAGKGQPRPGIGYKVDAVDADAGTVRLIGEKDTPIIWSPAMSGGDRAEAFVEVEQEFRAGDRIQFTRNNYTANRLNGHTATVVELDPIGGSMVVERQRDGKLQRLDLHHLADRYVRHGWVQTIHAAQGATSDRVMAHMESFRTNTVDTRAAYVAISRARSYAVLYTDSRAKLAQALGSRDVAQVGAIDELDTTKGQLKDAARKSAEISYTTNKPTFNEAYSV